MSDMTATRAGFAARLRATIGTLLLALLNATLLLFIVAAIAGIVLIGKARTLASDVAADMSRAAIASTGLDPAATLEELRALRTDVADLRQALAARREDIGSIGAALSARLDRVDGLLDELRERRLALADRTVARIAAAAGDFVNDVRGCRAAGDADP